MSKEAKQEKEGLADAGLKKNSRLDMHSSQFVKRPKFKGWFADLKGHDFDCTNLRYTDKFIRSMMEKFEKSGRDAVLEGLTDNCTMFCTPGQEQAKDLELKRVGSPASDIVPDG